MTNLVDRPNSPRGERRRGQLIDAGVALLLEGGWPAVTTRLVAERAGANLGLIHYHFGGLAGLHAAIARQAGELVIGPFIAELLGAPTAGAAVRAARDLMRLSAGDDRTRRLTVELAAGGLRDPALGAVLRDQFREARQLIADRLGQWRPDWSQAQCRGAATLAAALLDGLGLHQVLDPELPAGEALELLEELVTEEGPS